MGSIREKSYQTRRPRDYGHLDYGHFAAAATKIKPSILTQVFPHH
jgi:hypothetical protein